tara:strand:- start:811 stop:1722 length:912 start_codon:yes stop_codon:yes gene_type:complete
MKAIVTGAAGFIGSNIVDRLIEKGFDVVGVDNLIVGNRENINQKCDFHNIDFRNFKELEKVTNGADIFYHIGALLPITRPPFEDTVFHEEVNVTGTIQAVKACVSNNVRKFVYASTCAVYGEATSFPTKETDEIKLQTRPYSIQKYCGEQIALLLCNRHSIQCSSLRYFATYGPRCFYPEKGFNSYSPVIGIFLNQNKNGKPLTVTGDGSQKRDFIYVDDVARITMEVGISERGNQDIFNVCSSTNISILELAKKISDNIEFIDRTHGEVDLTLGDNRKLQDYFDLRPEIDIDTGIKLFEKTL